MEDLKPIRVKNLQALLQEVGGKKVDLARLIKKSPAQISQWNSGYRTIEEDTAREIERNAKKPPGWLDVDPERRGSTTFDVREPDAITFVPRPSVIPVHLVVQRLAEILERMPAPDRAAVVEQLTTLARAPDSQITRESLIVALGGQVETSSTKRTGS